MEGIIRQECNRRWGSRKNLSGVDRFINMERSKLILLELRVRGVWLFVDKVANDVSEIIESAEGLAAPSFLFLADHLPIELQAALVLRSRLHLVKYIVGAVQKAVLDLIVGHSSMNNIFINESVTFILEPISPAAQFCFKSVLYAWSITSSLNYDSGSCTYHRSSTKTRPWGYRCI